MVAVFCVDLVFGSGFINGGKKRFGKVVKMAGRKDTNGGKYIWRKWREDGNQSIPVKPTDQPTVTITTVTEYQYNERLRSKRLWREIEIVNTFCDVKWWQFPLSKAA